MTWPWLWYYNLKIQVVLPVLIKFLQFWILDCCSKDRWIHVFELKQPRKKYTKYNWVFIILISHTRTWKNVNVHKQLRMKLKASCKLRIFLKKIKSIYFFHTISMFLTLSYVCYFSFSIWLLHDIMVLYVKQNENQRVYNVYRY